MWLLLKLDTSPAAATAAGMAPPSRVMEGGSVFQVGRSGMFTGSLLRSVTRMQSPAAARRTMGSTGACGRSLTGQVYWVGVTLPETRQRGSVALRATRSAVRT